MNHRTIIAAFLTFFIISSCVNSYLKMLWQETSFIEELMDPMGIFIRLVIAFVLTQAYFNMQNKRKHGRK